MQVRELEALRKAVERRAEKAPRWNADPKDVQKSVARLVLALIEFLRKLLGIGEPNPPEEAIAGLPSIVVTYELDLPASGLARGATTAG